MSQPTSRAEFIRYTREMLGEPVIRLELADRQCENLVDDALQLFREYHYDATVRTFYKVQVDQTILDNKYLECPDNVISVVRIVSCTESNLNLFDIRYQLRLQDFYNFSNVSMQHYYITMEKLALLDWLLNPQPTIQFTRYENKIHLNLDWETRAKIGDFLVFEVYQALDETTKIWQDRWLKRYAVALFKRQWASNIKKFANIQTLGGVPLNGQILYDEAVQEITELETKLLNDYSPPCRIFMG
jgi:hypothetical protein